MIQALAAGTSVVAGGDQLVDQALAEGVGRLEAGALEQHVHEGRAEAEHPDDAGDATTAGEQAEGGLGEADHRGGVVEQYVTNQ